LCLAAILPCAALAAQARLSYGQVVEDRLSAWQPEMRYVFSGREGDAVLITVDAAEPDRLDPLVILLDAAQRQVLALDDDSGGAVNARLRHILTRSDDYLIKVMAAPKNVQTSGTFRLRLSLLNPTPTPSPLSAAPRLAPLSAGESVRAELNDQVPFRLYAVYALAGRPLSFSLRLENALPIGLYLYSHDFERRLATAELNDQLSFIPSADGWYWLVVSRIGQAGGGAYTLTRGAERPIGAPKAEGVRLVAGLAQSGALSPRFATLYHFEAQSRSRVDLLLQAQGVLPALILLADERFAQLAVGEGALRAVELPHSGRYYALVARSGGPNDPASGAYTLTLSGAFTPLATATPMPKPSVVPLRSGETARGILDDQRFLAYYSFTAARSTNILIELTAESGTLQPVAYLYSYQGDQPRLMASAMADDAQRRTVTIQQTLPEDGAYLIVVARYGAAQGTTQGVYSVKLTLRAP